MFPELIKIKAVERYKLRLLFADGTDGIVDVVHLCGKGIFKAWDEGDLFFKVKIDPETNAIHWNEAIELDAVSFY